MNRSGSEKTRQEPLTHRQRLAIAEILASPTFEEARRRVKAAKGTFYGWLKEPAFQEELKHQREVLVDRAFDRLKAGMSQAVEKLTELLQVDGKFGIQLRAAQAFLDYGIKAMELQEIESRLEALEKRIGNGEERP